MIMTETRRVDLARADPQAVLELLRRHDLRGHGGGAFPTATKITVSVGGRPRLIINACDGEPMVAKDRAILQQVPHLLADGIALVSRIVEPREILVAVHRGSPSAALAERLVGLTATRPRLKVLAVPHRYVSSEASSLANLAAGREARPVTKVGPLTAAGPGRGRVPALVLNAETVARVAALWLDPTPAATTRLVTIAGAVAQPQVSELPVSTTIATAVAGAGGPTSTPRAVLAGGFAGRWLPWSEAADLSLSMLGRDLGAGLIMVQGADCPLPVVGRILATLAAESAGQCGPCMFGLPAIAEDWALLERPDVGGAADERLRRRLPVIRGRGACHHPDGAVAMAASALGVFGDHVREHRHGRCAPAGRALTGVVG